MARSKKTPAKEVEEVEEETTEQGESNGNENGDDKKPTKKEAKKKLQKEQSQRSEELLELVKGVFKITNAAIVGKVTVGDLTIDKRTVLSFQRRVIHELTV